MSVTVAELKALTGSEKPDGELTLFVNQAALVVSSFLSGTTLDASILASVELYMAGHFYVLSVEGGGITYTRAGQSEHRFKTYGYDAHGFMSTRFGQMACTLDTTGTLLAASKKDKVPLSVESISPYRPSS